MQGLHTTIWTQNHPRLPELVARYFSGATITYSLGLWNGQTEDAAQVHIIFGAHTPPAEAAAMPLLVEDIRKECAQDAVLVTVQALERCTVYNGGPQEAAMAQAARALHSSLLERGA